MNKLDILSSKISFGTTKEFIHDTFNLSGSSSYICFANVHMVVEAYRDPSFQKTLNTAAIASPDGKPLSLFMRLFYGIKQARICGMDFMPQIMKEAERRGKSIFFYGDTREVLDVLLKKCRVDFPNLKIAGTHSPPFRKLTEREDREDIEMINRSKADFVFVSLGCPKQEKWMAAHMNKISACMLGLGQAFRVYAGLEKRLPKWMRDLSLEWAHRLFLEPGRLWKRYLVTNSLFLFLTMKYALTRAFSSLKLNWHS